jgi:hypothetical protein
MLIFGKALYKAGQFRATRRSTPNGEGAMQKAVGKVVEANIEAIANAAATGKPAPRSDVPAAKLAVEVATDHLAALRAARMKCEADVPLVEKDAVAADVEIDRLISLILVPLAQQLITRGRQIAAQLRPYTAVLSALWAEADRPTGWDDGAAFDEGRKPLTGTREEVAAFLRATHVIERARPDPWVEVRKRLREDPHAELPDICRSEDRGG